MGYRHIELSAKSKELCTIVTQWVKYEYQRLPMGMWNSPVIFQEMMSELFVSLDTVLVYIDDLLHFAKALGQNILLSSKRSSPDSRRLGSRSRLDNHALVPTNWTIWVITSPVTGLCPYQIKSRPFNPSQSPKHAKNCVSSSVLSTYIVTCGKIALSFLPH